ncbi:hypothetical protein HOD19_01085 [bacterium]|nr:hypothetical protein [bacterium]MBT4649361.1 hypothetical protein [bacterium]
MSSGYAYLGTKKNDKELSVVRLSDYTEVNTLDLSGNSDMTAISISDNVAYMTRKQSADKEFYAIDISSPEGALNILGSADTDDDANDVSIGTNGNAYVASKDNAKELYVFDTSTYSEIGSLNLAGNDDAEAVYFLGAYVYVGGKTNANEISIAQSSGATSDENIYNDSMQNSWSLSNNNATVDSASTLMLNSGTNSLSANYADQTAYVRYAKSFDTSNYLNLNFYLNTVSPWAHAVYGDDANGASDYGAEVTMLNTTHADFIYNSSDFLDFPSPDMASYKTLAQGTASYINAGGGDFTLDENNGDISDYEGKLVYVEFSNTNKKLKLKFDDEAGPFNVSFVTNGKIELDKYEGTTLNTISSNYPVLLADTKEIKFKDKASMTVNGLIFTGGEFKSNDLNGGHRITLNGSIVAETISNKLERVDIVYTNDYHTSPPLYFSPDYYGQDFDIKADVGTTVFLTDYLAAGIDNDIDTWELVSVPLSDMNISTTTINYLQFEALDNQEVNLVTWFVDDIQLTGYSEPSDYSYDGWFTSSEYDSGSTNATWNSISWSASATTTDNTIKFQLRSAPDTAGVPGTWTDWLGPIDVSDYYIDDQGGETINTTHSDGTNDQWLQYRTFFTSDGVASPVLEDVSIEYN